MPFYFLPTISPSPLREETNATTIATLTRKGWQETTPPTPGAGQRAEWDGIAKAWTLVNNPPTPPDYAGFENALRQSNVMTANRNRLVPNITLSTPTTLAELRTAVLQLSTANDTAFAWERFTMYLDRLISEGDQDNAATISRFQTLLSNWLTAGNFGAPARTTIQGILDQFLPTRNYTAAP